MLAWSRVVLLPDRALAPPGFVDGVLDCSFHLLRVSLPWLSLLVWAALAFLATLSSALVLVDLLLFVCFVEFGFQLPNRCLFKVFFYYCCHLGRKFSFVLDHSQLAPIVCQYLLVFN
jgi:hypothetical protein